MPNQICHFQLVAPDPAKTREFLARVFNWSFRDDPAHHYTVIHTGADPNGGIVRTQPDGRPTCLIYVAVDDLEETLAKVAAAGGQVLQPASGIEGIGTWAIVADPDGVPIGVFTPD
ncbi:MAG: VOC family protein [Armatimonadetes bacterium]|jgi:predicted enzyme related to lactoylglutathione lyase|nr:VOC family protein [Armatimonadota bacterium]